MKFIYFDKMCQQKTKKIKNVKQRFFSFLEKYFAFILPLFPILDVYCFPGCSFISCAEILLVLSLPLSLLLFHRSNEKIVYFSAFVLFFLYADLVTLINSCLFYPLNFSVGFFRIIREWAYLFFFFFIASNFINLKEMYKWYKFLVCFCCFLPYIEFFYFSIFGKTVLFLFPFLPLNYGSFSYQDLLLIRSSANLNEYFRATSCFAEPSYFAYYCSPFLFLLLFSNDCLKEKIFLFLYISFSLLLSKSVTSYVIIISILVLAFFVKTPFKRRTKISIFLFSLSLVVPIFIISGNGFSRILEIFDFSGSETSGGYRIYRGYHIFSKSNFIQALFGIGYGNIIPFFRANGITEFAGTYEDFSSSLPYLLISTGFLGTCLFLFPLVHQCRKQKSTYYFAYLVICLLLFSVDQLFFSTMYVVIMSILFAKNDFFIKNMKYSSNMHIKNISL